jgi:hypothetical protein
MELLRRSLLIGCALPAIWLFRLATLDPLVSVIRVDPAVLRPGETMEVAVSVSGGDWDLLVRDLDALEQGLAAESRWRVSPDAPDAGQPARWVYFRTDDVPVRSLRDKLASGAGTTLVAATRPDGAVYYRLDRREFTRQAFEPGAGFKGKPAPPAELLYPFHNVAYACLFLGIALFALIPSPTKARGGITPGELALLAVGLGLFGAPLLATGGSVQALTRWLPVTAPCWVAGAMAIHFFAKPGLNAPHPIFQPAPEGGGRERIADSHLPTFLRWGVVMLAVAAGPLAVLIAVSLTFWNR